MGQVRVDLEKCNKDGICVQACPLGAIEMDPETNMPVAAVDYITSVTLCGVDGVKAEKGCHVERDLNVTVGGISNVTVEAMAIDAAMVGNTKLCLFVRACGEIMILMSKQIGNMK